MFSKSILTIFALAAVCSAAPLHRREVPQEHSHEQFLTTARKFLQMNNPAGIGDVVFGLLGDGAARGGAGSVSELACLQQVSADQAFTNAKAAGSMDGMVGALVYRALERNTPGVGKASAKCSQTAQNPEIAAIQQHQDPASPNAASINKAITLELARQIAKVGGDPQIAIKSGTFAPGDLSDTSGKGNTCDNQDDPTGCIFTQNKLVPDATPDEIRAAVAGQPVSSGGNNAQPQQPAQTGGSSGGSNNGGSNNGGGNNGGTAKRFDQCAGQLYKGPTNCEAGTTCQFQNPFYSQCL